MAQKLKHSTINKFCIGPIGFFLMMNFVGNYYNYFLTDILTISAATVGTILLVARIIDAIAVPVAGGIVEMAHQKWGKYSTWLWAAPPFTAFFIALMFTGPNLKPAALSFFLGSMYVLAHLTVNLAEASQYALIPVIAQTPEDRILLSSRRAQAMSAGQLIFGLVAPSLIVLLGGNNEGRGIFLTVLLFAILQMLGYWLVAQVAQPYDSGKATDAASGVSLKDMALQVVTNRPLFILIVAEILRWTANIVIGNFAVYYFKYVAQNQALIAVFFTCSSIATFLGSALGQLVTRKVSKKQSWYIGMSINFLALIPARIFARNTILFITFAAVAAVGHAIVMNLSAAFFADVAEYAQRKTKKDAKGVIMSLSSLPIKISVALSGAIAGYSLALIGYDPNIAATTRIIDGIISFSTLIPAFFALAAILAIKFYPLPDRIQDLSET
ncbi:MAG: MFS transporter [Firmicutes bacterium]|nr:MFS transporter [Bacillota bacterium]